MDNRVPQHLPPPGYLMTSNLAQLHQTPPLASPPLPHNHNAIFSAPHLLTLRNAVPAKRGSDEVQFVSSNPVKKRKLDAFSSPAPSPPLLGARGATPPGASHLPPLAQAPPALPVAASIPTSTPYIHSEANMITRVLPQASTGEAPRFDALRGASEPVLSTVDFSDMWTAPSRGPKSSPAVSPKQMPLHIPQPQIGQDSQKDSQPFITSNQSRPEEASTLQGPTPSPSQGHKHSPLSAPTPAEKENRDNQVPSSEPEAPSLMAQLDFRGLNMLPEDSEQPVGSSHKVDPSGGTVEVDPPQHHQSEGPTTQTPDAPVAVQALSLTTEPVADSITVATSQQMHETAPQQDLRSSPSQPSFQGQQQAGNVQCQGGPQHTAKNNCYHCFQVWLKRNGALMPQGAAFMTPAAKPQMMPYQVAYQQQWPQQLGMDSFPTQLQNAASYAQLLRQQSPSTQEQRLQHQQHASTAPAAPVAPMMASMSGLSASTNMPQPSMSMWNAQSAGLLQNPPRPTRPPQNHPNGKHIIVDMAETCLESFPFDEFAQRHNQPPKRIKEIFEAIIQMPLLRCPTDKRRAGKVATAQMKEYTQAKKDLQAQMANGQTQNQGSMPQPSAWEMAQYLGPSDVPIPGHLAFPGPW